MLESIKSSDVFGNVRDCCLDHFSWNPNCVADSPVKESDSSIEVEQVPTPPPTRKPVSLYIHPPTSEPSPSTRSPTRMPSQKPSPLEIKSPRPTLVPTLTMDEHFQEPLIQEKPIDSLDSYSQESRYFPIFGGEFTVCENTGPIPSWMSESTLQYSKSDCCRNFAFQWDYDKCMDYSTSPSFSGGDSAGYFPDFRAEICVNSETEEAPSYMSRIYFKQSIFRCCSKFFSRNEKLLEKCESFTIS